METNYHPDKKKNYIQLHINFTRYTIT